MCQALCSLEIILFCEFLIGGFQGDGAKHLKAPLIENSSSVQIDRRWFSLCTSSDISD